jgi:hypothetical protein
MKREEKLLKIKSELQDFEKCLNEADGDLAVAFEKWLEKYRLVGVIKTVVYWVNMEWNEEEVKSELQEMYRLIDEDLEKIKTEEV